MYNFFSLRICCDHHGYQLGMKQRFPVLPCDDLAHLSTVQPHSGSPSGGELLKVKAEQLLSVQVMAQCRADFVYKMRKSQTQPDMLEMKFLHSLTHVTNYPQLPPKTCAVIQNCLSGHAFNSCNSWHLDPLSFLNQVAFVMHGQGYLVAMFLHVLSLWKCNEMVTLITVVVLLGSDNIF